MLETIYLAAATLFTSLGSPLFAKDYEGHWATGSITEWKDKGVINGYEDGSFKPKENMTKAELATVLANVFGLKRTTGAAVFIDVKVDAWYADAIAKVTAAGLMHIEGTRFNPNAPATREEAAYAIAQAYKISGSGNKEFKDHGHIAGWSVDAISALVANGYLAGRPDGTFGPKDYLTRADIIAMIDRITAELFNVKGTYTGLTINGNVVINTSDVILKDTVINGNVYIAQGVGNGNVVLDNVTVNGNVIIEGGGCEDSNGVHFKGETSVDKVTVTKPDGEVNVSTSDKAEIGTVVVESDVKLSGTFIEVVVINKVNVTVTNNSKVETIVVEKEAEKSNIELQANVVVVEVKLNCITYITGSGQITLLVLAPQINYGHLVIKVIVIKIEGGIGVPNQPNKEQEKDENQSNNNSGSSSGSIAKQCKVRGQVTLHNRPVEGATVELVPFITVDGQKVLDRTTSQMVVTDADGFFDFGKVDSKKAYQVIASYEGGKYEAECNIRRLTSNRRLRLELSEPIEIYDAYAIDDNTIQVITNAVGDVRTCIYDNALNGIYHINWTAFTNLDLQVTTIELPRGKHLEADKEYTVELRKPGFENYITTTVVYTATNNTQSIMVQGDVTCDLTEAMPGQEVEFKVTTTAGYKIKDMAVIKMAGGEVPVKVVDVENGVYAFRMPECPVIIKVVTEKFEEKPEEETWKLNQNSFKGITIEDVIALTTSSTYFVSSKGNVEAINWDVTTSGSYVCLSGIDETGTYKVLGEVDNEVVGFSVILEFIPTEMQYLLVIREEK